MSPGTDWCIDLVLGWEWPENGDPVLDGQPIANISGCGCFDDVQSAILEEQTPQCDYQHHVGVLIAEARAECAAAATPGYENNCDWTVSEEMGVNPPEFEALAQDGVGACPGSCGEHVGDCEEELQASCPEPSDTDGPGCVDGDGDGDVDDEADEESDDGGDGLDAGSYITCDGNSCEIEEELADRLYADPLLLLGETARLTYNSQEGRYKFINVASGSLAWELGLRSGDLLGTVNGANIVDEESALEAAADLWGSTSLTVRIKRGSTWEYFYYDVV